MVNVSHSHITITLLNISIISVNLETIPVAAGWFFILLFKINRIKRYI